MTRRASSDATNDSLKENTDFNARTKADKAKQGKATRNARAARVEEQHEDEDSRVPGEDDAGEGETQDGEYDEDEGAEGDEDGQDGGSPKGRKRARANSIGDSHPSGSKKGKAKAEPKTLPRDVDGYVPFWT